MRIIGEIIGVILFAIVIFTVPMFLYFGTTIGMSDADIKCLYNVERTGIEFKPGVDETSLRLQKESR